MTPEEEFRLNGEIAAIKATLALTLGVLSGEPNGPEMVAAIKEKAFGWAREVRVGLRPHPLNDVGHEATMEALDFMFSRLGP